MITLFLAKVTADYIFAEPPNKISSCNIGEVKRYLHYDTAYNENNSSNNSASSNELSNAAQELQKQAEQRVKEALNNKHCLCLSK
ncbi:MAG: hypothetical protein WDL99_08835 [Candidatus Omnitrophota bacterium]